MSAAERFWSKVDRDGPVPDARPELGPCWLWTGHIDDAGYGRFGIAEGHAAMPHRFAYEEVVGPIADGLTIDHLCRNRACCNPAHLEPVTMAENLHRSPYTQASINAAKTHCPAGHEYAGPNLAVYSGRRRCRACDADRHARNAERINAKRRARYAQRVAA